MSRYFAMVGWDRGQRIPRKVQKRGIFESEPDRDTRDRSTELLLALLSCAIRVEPALLRAVRCLLGPDRANAGGEAGFWNHADILSNPIACSYASLDAVTRYRNTFRLQPRALQEQVIRTIAEYHAGLPEEIQNEEKRIARSLLGENFLEQETLMQRFSKSYFKDPDHAGYRSWVLRMAERQHRDIWENSEALSAIWVKAHEKELKSGRKLEIPEGLDLSSASWVLAGSRKQQTYTVDQVGQSLTLRRESGAGSPVGKMDSSTGMFQVVIESQECGRQSYGFEFSESNNRIPLPESGRVRLATEPDEILLETLLKPDWAGAMGRGRHGLFAVLPETSGSRRLYWMNPGFYPVAGREYFLKNGFFIDEPEYQSWLEHGFRKPGWADEFGVDEYGLYAIFNYKNVSQTMRWIPPGSFWMGSPEDEPGRYDNETSHEVVLTRGFWLADTACTQALYEEVTGNNPSRFKGRDRPVENVSWRDARAFIENINAGLPGSELRLPSEAEWEVACRSGSTTAYWFGDAISRDLVNYGGGESVKVKSLPCNHWGLYEMHGNVWEWCQDWYGPYTNLAVVDPAGPAEGGARVLRGGCWDFYARWSRSACRFRLQPGDRIDLTGFRLARGQSSSPGGALMQESSSPGQSQRSGDGQGLRAWFKRLLKK
ncbi:MAG: formylglycine-generating enzyme family protein [Methylococcales bacterium]